MPLLKDAELIEAIEMGKFCAITLDTTVFDKFGCALEFPILAKLDQFAKADLKIVFSEVIAGEVKAHITKALAETSASMRAALNQHKKKWRVDTKKRDEAAAAVQLDRNPQDTAKAFWNEYVASVKGSEVPANDLVAPADVLSRYFSNQAPFEDKADKKHEFPDALALLSLEAWAKKQNKLLLAISQDKGWHRFAEASDTIVVCEDINNAYAIVNKSAQAVAAGVYALLLDGKAKSVDDGVAEAIQGQLDDVDFDIEASSYYSFQEYPESAELQTVSYDTQPSVIDFDDDTVTLAMLVTATVKATATFSFSVMDSVDRDMVPMGSSTVQTTNEVPFELVLTVPRKFEGDPQLIEWEISKGGLGFDFGEIEPFSREDFDH